MNKQILISVKMLVLFTILTGFVYPMVVLGFGQFFFNQKANGSFVQKEGITIGSELIAQKFESARYFWPRPSSIDYNTLSSGGSNLSLISTELRDNRMANQKRFGQDAPADLLYASGSGLDPEISINSALSQVKRITNERKLTEAPILDLIKTLSNKRSLAILGEPRINVLNLNLALDRL